MTLAVLLLALAPTGDAASQSTARAATKPVVLRDAACTNRALAPSDAREFRVLVTDDALDCTLVMARPIVEGMFLCAHLAIDCDDNPGTGDERGQELAVRAAVGSRFAPLSAPAGVDGRTPLEHRRLSYTKYVPRSAPEEGREWVLFPADDADPPEVADRELRFRVPLQNLRELTSTTLRACAIRVQVETSNADQPLERLHLCLDEGMPIVIDGTSEEWSAPEVRDRGDELHAMARCIDLTRLRVEHGPDRVFACLDLAATGFTAWPRDEDVFGGPVLRFFIEPVYPNYQRAYEVMLWGGEGPLEETTPIGAWQAVVKGTTVEAAFPRVQGQNRLRVIVTSELKLTDAFEDVAKVDLRKDVSR